jgi:hypothetical protein
MPVEVGASATRQKEGGLVAWRGLMVWEKREDVVGDDSVALSVWVSVKVAVAVVAMSNGSQPA